MSAKLFEPVGSRSNKVRCTVCGAKGYDVPLQLPSGRGTWKAAHLRGHSPCRWCGKQLSLMINGQPRVHSRCPQRGPL